jgi:hypothetical protein
MPPGRARSARAEELEEASGAEEEAADSAKRRPEAQAAVKTKKLARLARELKWGIVMRNTSN